MTARAIRVIVVEDVEADAELALHALRKGGFDPDAVRVEDEATFLANLQREPDLILCDYKLPQFDAPTALRIAKKKAPGVPVVIVTGTMGDEAAAATIKGGATDYVLKENMARLPRVVARALDEVALRQEVERTEARYRQVVESVPAVVYTAEAGDDGRWLYLSPQVETVLGVTVEAITNDWSLWTRCIHPADRERVDAAERSALETRSDLEIEYRFVKPDGTVLWVRDEATIVDGDRPCFHGVISDVTDRKLAEEALRTAEQTYRGLVQTVNAVVWRADARAGRLTFVSQEARDLFGYPIEAWTSTPGFWEEHIHEDDRAATAVRAKEALQDRSSYISEYRMIAADGRIVWVRDLVEVVVHDDEVMEFVGLMVDITELKDAEREAANRVEQQIAVVELGQLALRGFSVQVLLDEAVQLLSSTLGLASTLVARPEDAGLRVVAGSGYRPGVVGSALLPAGTGSPEGLTIATELPVVSLDVHRDERFSFAPLPGEDAVVSGMSAVIRDEAGLFGAISAYSTLERAFSHDDVNFLQAIANVLSSSIRRDRSQREIAFQARLLYEVGAAVCVTDRHGTITHWNDAAATALGIDAEEALGRGAAEVLLGTEAAPAARSMLDHLEPGDRMTTEWSVRTKTGGTVPFHISVSAQADDRGQLDRIIFVGVDITDRKEMEKRLRESEDQFRTAFMSMPAGMMVCDVDGRYVTVNDAFCEMLGYSRDELIGRSYMDITHPDDVEQNEEWFSRLVEVGGTVNLTKRYVRKDGSAIWAEVTDIVLRDDAEHNFHALVYVLDVTERKKAEEERERLEKQLLQSQKMEAVGRLAGGIAHDFNNLLSVIINYSAFLDEDMPDEDPRKEDLKEIRAAGERATALVRRLLTFSRREPGDVASVDINEVVSELRGLLERSIGEDIAIEIALPDTEFLVKADTSHLEQILMNLVVNARDAMPKGGTIQVVTAIENIAGSDATLLDVTPGSFVRLRVTDDGEGIAPEVIDHVFEPFFTTKAREQGTGLGLSTVYGLVNQSGGAIRVDTAVGKGTTFDVLIPCDAHEVGSSAEPPESEGARTVLVVEDDDTLRHVVVRSLEGRGYRVIDAASADEAIALVEASDDVVDILLTDVVLPGMTGTKLAERLRRSNDLRRFVFMTGYDAEDVLETSDPDLVDAGFLQKPFSNEDLYDKLEEVMVG